MSSSQTSLALKDGLNTIWQGVLDLLYPPHCLLCKTSMEAGCLCPLCIRSFHLLAPPFCDRCGVQVGMEAEGRLCAGCAEGRHPPYEGAFAPAHFAGKMRDAIHLLKYEERVALAEPLGKLLAEFVRENSTLKSITFDGIVPVPLHPSRLRQRGFNQAERLARVISEENGTPLDGRNLIRQRATRSQATLSGEERRGNLVDAFATHASAPFTGKTLLLVDDVLTTTATVTECARVLKNGGAKRVYVLALARGG